MSVLTKPRHALVEDAVQLAKTWCAGHVIDGGPALGHAVKVARKAAEHDPSIRPELTAALILHDAPEYARDDPDLPTAESVYGFLAVNLNTDVARLVKAITDEHTAMERLALNVGRMDREVLFGIAVDKVVAIKAITMRGRRAEDPASFWARRQPFRERLSYFHDWAFAAAPRLPLSLRHELIVWIDAAVTDTSAYTSSGGEH